MWTLRGLVLLGLLAASYQRSRPTHYENTFATGDELELRVYLSEQLRFKDFNNSAALIWHATGMRYDMSSAGDIETTVQVNVTQHMLNNGSMYCHSFFTKVGKSPDPKALGSYDRWSSTHTIMSMITHAERLKPIGLYNLLTGEPRRGRRRCATPPTRPRRRACRKVNSSRTGSRRCTCSWWSTRRPSRWTRCPT